MPPIRENGTTRGWRSSCASATRAKPWSGSVKEAESSVAMGGDADTRETMPEMRSRYPRNRLIPILVALVAAATAGTATASRLPSRSESAAIASSVKFFLADWYYAGTSPPAIRVSGIRISSPSPNWALVVVSAPAAHGRPAIQRTELLVWHATGSPNVPDASGRLSRRRWVVVTPRLSMEYSWCGVPPIAVSRDLAVNLGC